MNSRSCMCEGSNENCTICFGTGFYTPTDEAGFLSSRQNRPSTLELLRRTLEKGSPEEQELSKRRLAALTEICTQCNFRGLPDELRQHISVKHPRRETPFQITKSPQSMHKRARNKKARAIAPNSSGSSPKTEGQKLRELLIAKGIIKPVAAKKSRPSKKSGSKSRSPATSSNSCFKEYKAQSGFEREDYMDAHRSMGFAVRENGRYGSHALHDRYDDESAP